MSTFYPQNDYRGYLSHHGIKGQKWGEQNGPPYPLSARLHNMVTKGKAIRAEKRREKILHDPKKLKKHSKEFTKEEIDNAAAKIKSIQELDKLIPQKKKDRPKKKTINEKIADNKLRRKIDKYGSTAYDLDKNSSKFTTEELKQALERISKKNEIFEKKMDAISKPSKVLDVGNGYLKTISNLIKNVKDINSKLKKNDPSSLDFKQKQMVEFEKKNLLWLLGENVVKSHAAQKKAEYEESKRSRNPSDQESVAANVISTPLNLINSRVIDWYNEAISQGPDQSTEMDDWEKLVHTGVSMKEVDKIFS